MLPITISMDKLVLLDIDGVLSLERPVNPSQWSIDSVSYDNNYENTLRVNIPNRKTIYRKHTYRPEIINAIDSLIVEEKLEFKFLSNWGEAAKSVFSKYVGLKNVTAMDIDAKELGTAKPYDSLNPVYWYKTQALIREATLRGRETIFIDDLLDEKMSNELQKVLPEHSGWLRINPMIGLTIKEIEYMSDWNKGKASIIRSHEI